ncbi:MAG: blue (type 1) copper domain protein [Marmoricola sp.]|nr:blue (type 1) copper domain protein [Marmoricola sp.]
MRLPKTRSVVLLTALLGLAVGVPMVQAGASSGSAAVSVVDDSFTPATVKVAQGHSVTWTFKDPVQHSTTSDQGFWTSGLKSSGTYTRAFPDAGTFAYHCTMHSFMKGHVQVPLADSGSSSHGWTLHWSSAASTPSSIRFDVQYRKSGASTWSSWRTRSASRSALFNPSRSATYQVRARTDLGSKASGWSPLLTVKIT